MDNFRDIFRGLLSLPFRSDYTQKRESVTSAAAAPPPPTIEDPNTYDDTNLKEPNERVLVQRPNNNNEGSRSFDGDRRHGFNGLGPGFRDFDDDPFSTVSEMFSVMGATFSLMNNLFLGSLGREFQNLEDVFKEMDKHFPSEGQLPFLKDEQDSDTPSKYDEKLALPHGPRTNFRDLMLKPGVEDNSSNKLDHSDGSNSSGILRPFLDNDGFDLDKSFPGFWHTLPNQNPSVVRTFGHRQSKRVIVNGNTRLEETVTETNEGREVKTIRINEKGERDEKVEFTPREGRTDRIGAFTEADLRERSLLDRYFRPKM